MLTLSSPAKVNLFLKVYGRRPDGFCEITTLLQAISLFDTLTFKRAITDRLTCTNPQIPVDGNNLVIKALTLFRKKTGLQTPFHIHLDKKIPSEAGLGGGSGNAATTLWALNQLHNSPASEEDLKSWSSEIGSDIPFFFSCGTALCTGRGERIQPLDPLLNIKMQIIKPLIGLSTAQVYRALHLKESKQIAPQALLKDYLQGEVAPFNDLEAPAFTLCPSLSLLKEKLQQKGFHTVLMSGSGSALFCMGEGSVEASPTYHIHEVTTIQRTLNSWY